MRDKTGVTLDKELDDREVSGFVIAANDIDTCATAVKAYGGVVFGVNGTNEGWQDLLNPRPPGPTDQTLWGHALFAKGYHLHNGLKCIIAKSSWCNSGILEHHIKENYFVSDHTFNPWTLIPKEQTMTNSLLLKHGTEYGFYDPATSPDGLITQMRNRGINPPLKVDGTLDFGQVDTMVQGSFLMSPKEHISQIIADNSARLLEKYDRGQQEHGGNLWQKPGVLKMLEQEILDATTYQHTIAYQIQSTLQYLLDGDIESCKKVLTDLLADPIDK